MILEPLIFFKRRKIVVLSLQKFLEIEYVVWNLRKQIYKFITIDQKAKRDC